MKKIIKMMLFLLAIVPIKAFAFTGNVKLECDSNTATAGNNINCTITGNNFSDEISSFHAAIDLDDNLILESIEKDSSWEGSGEGGVIDLYTDKNKTGNVNFINFTVKVNDSNASSNTNIVLTDIKIGDSDFKEHSLADSTFSIKINSNNNESDNENKEEDNDDEENNDENIKDENNDKPEDNIENNDKNPETGNVKTIIVSIIMFGALFIALLYVKKMKDI